MGRPGEEGGGGGMSHQDDDNKIKCMPRTGSRTTKYITRCPEQGWELGRDGNGNGGYKDTQAAGQAASMKR